MHAYTQNIEQIILDNFDNARKTIVIVVAWFTNKKIILKLIELRKFKNIDIQILVDNNSINDKYFFIPYSSILQENGIEIKKQQNNKFNHNKFSIIDNETLITGSYNYTNKANYNLENIIVEKNSKIANYYFRVFKFFTEENYIDSNIEILLNDFEFANKLISTYYNFSSKLMTKLQNKIIIGFCFTHENGLYNEISYEPGLIFNPKYKLHKKLKKVLEKQKQIKYCIELLDCEFTQEFELPITKELISNFKTIEINNFNYQTIQEIAHLNKSEINYDHLGDDFLKTEFAVKKYYTRKFNTIYSTKKLKQIIQNKIDIIIEDYIWINNFAPFLNDNLVEKIYLKNCR